MSFIKYQPLEGFKPDIQNEDCLVRAISRWRYSSLAPLDAWEQALYFTNNICIETRVFPANLDYAICEYFKQHGCVVREVERRRTISSIAKSGRKPMFLITKNHIVFCSEGHFYDSWDSGRHVVKKIIFLEDYFEEQIEK